MWIPPQMRRNDRFQSHAAGSPPRAASEGARQSRRVRRLDARQRLPLRSGASRLCAVRRPGAPQRAPVLPVVRVSARILQVQDVPSGGRIGYSATYRAASPRRIATIAAGYADGVFRHASAANEESGGAVAIRGKLAPIVGRVSMDLITVDITDIGDPAPERGDFVDLVVTRVAARSRRHERAHHRL